MEQVVRVTEEIVGALAVILGKVLGVQDCTDRVKLPSADEGPKSPLIDKARLHEVGCMEAAWLSGVTSENEADSWKP